MANWNTKDFFDFQEQVEYQERSLSIAQQNYLIAMQHYVLLKQSFLRDVTEGMQRQTIKQISQEFVGKVENDFKSLMADQLQDMTNNVQEALSAVSLFYKIPEHIVQTLQQLGQEKAKRGKADTYFQRIVDSFQKALITDSVLKDQYEVITNFLAAQNITSQNPKSAEAKFITRNLLTFLQKNNMFISQNKNASNSLLSREALSGYARNFSGLRAEEVGAEVINQSIKNLSSNSDIKFYLTSDAGDSSNMHYDLLSSTVKSKNYQKVLRNLETWLDNVNNTFSSSVTVNANLPTEIEVQYGIQSKQGWAHSIIDAIDAMHKESKIPIVEKFFEVGDRKEVAKSLGFKIGQQNDPISWYRGFHYSIEVLSSIQNFFAVIGMNQLGYRVRGHFLWMSDIISQMKANNLYLAFYYNRIENKKKTGMMYAYPTSGLVAWQKLSYLYRTSMMEKMTK